MTPRRRSVGCASAHLLAAVLALAAGPAAAWTFTPVPVCTLDHSAPDGTARVTYDPATGLYEIALQRAAGVWPAAPAFSIAFDGPRPLTIATNRHVRSADRRTLRVTDTGFGNVLDGLQFNTQAVARAGAVTLRLPLTDASPAVDAFRTCPGPTLS